MRLSRWAFVSVSRQRRLRIYWFWTETLETRMLVVGESS